MNTMTPDPELADLGKAFTAETMAVLNCDPQGSILRANPQFFVMSGWAKSDFPLPLRQVLPHVQTDGKLRSPCITPLVSRHGETSLVVFGPTARERQFFLIETSLDRASSNLLATCQNKMRRVAVELSLARERERRAVAEMLHDLIGQDLALAKLRLSQLCVTADGEQRESLEEIHSLVTASLRSSRTLSQELGTPALYKLGLVPALKNLLAELARDGQLHVSADFCRDPIILPLAKRVILYRVIRELLLNVVKHACATKLEFLVQRKDHNLTITILDNGKGFNFSAGQGSTDNFDGLGLFLVHERVLQIGGTIQIESNGTNGTKAILTAPLECQAAETKL